MSGIGSGLTSMFSNWMVNKTPSGEKREPAFDTKNDQSGTQQNNNNNKDNANGNSDNNVDLLDTVWKATQKKEEPNNQNPNGNGNPNGNNNNPQVDPQKMIADHLKEVGIEGFTLTDQEKENLKNGEGFDSLVERINKQTQNAYVGAMKGTNKLIQEAVKSAVAEATTNANNNLEGVRLKDFLETSIPYIKGDEVLGPVTETAFKSFYEKTGKDKAKSLELTKQFLKRSAETVNKNDPTLVGLNNESFNQKPAGAGASGDQSWLDVLKR